MAIRIDKEELIKRVNKQWKSKPFYRIPALNYQGTATNSDNSLLEEDIAEWLYGKIEDAGSLDVVDKMLLEHSTMQFERRDFPEGDGPIHLREAKINNTNRNEENIAKALFNQGRVSSNIEIVDYQVPVNRVLHSGNGKVDLVMKDKEQAILCELKDDKSEETLLRAIVEARTYFLKASKTEVVNEEGKQTAHDRFVSCYGDNFWYGVAFFENTKPYDSWKNPNLEHLRALASAWDVQFYLVGRRDKKAKETYFMERQ